ncbi:unnamed protein product [Zymoseptoria tritici ST99CH_1A5]|uniref:Uncharacterized protein n=2 Tax=Zymoseptoria tritici TaxID=1047171 RepID=A0A2H1GU15_ZYMTR|nr:unnamed protein product [Zymoseptoria tritici ST99CH_1E4]SMR59916.1 unnamed protein product [Zymoseptoria tritici ST99CH_3D1]SMY27104.1 unnamed protein product [Zymoseptoria tritici ST99CH_1A5]
MAQPVLVRAYAGRGSSRNHSPTTRSQALPPISAYAFADILRAADSAEFQTAIDGIAELCAKNRMSLADEYASHLPPLGEITASTTTSRSHMLRPGMRRPLTSVPEGSSGSSEGSRKSKRQKKGSLFGFRRKQQEQQETAPVRSVRIGMMGRTVSVGSTTALAAEAWTQPNDQRISSESTIVATAPARPPRSSAAAISLQRLLGITQAGRDG